MNCTRNRASFGVLFGISLTLFSPAAMSAVTDLAATILQSCQTDLNQFCKNVTPGEGREMACLNAYNDKISAGCKQAIQDDVTRMNQFFENLEKTCANEMKQYCETSEDLKSLMKCLMDNKANLSSNCRTFTDQNPTGPA